MKVVFDTNLYVSSLISPNSVPASLIRLWKDDVFELVISQPTIAELRSVLGYEHLRQLNRITDEDVDRFIHLLEQHAAVIDGAVDVAGAIPDDPDDEAILACAVEGGALLIISGDKHLLDLKEYAHISIISARQFWDRFGTGQ